MGVGGAAFSKSWQGNPKGCFIRQHEKYLRQRTQANEVAREAMKVAISASLGVQLTLSVQRLFLKLSFHVVARFTVVSCN